MKSITAQNGDWYLSYDSLAAAAWRRNAKTPPNDARIIIRPPHMGGVGVAVVDVGCVRAGFVGAELIICGWE